MPYFIVPIEGQIILDGGSTPVYNAVLWTDFKDPPVELSVDGGGNYSVSVLTQGTLGYYLMANLIQADLWKENTDFNTGDRIVGGVGYWECSASGTTDAVVPSWDPLDSPITNGSVEWTYLSPFPNPVVNPSVYVPDIPDPDPLNTASFLFTPVNGNYPDMTDDEAPGWSVSVNGDYEYTAVGRPFDPTSSLTCMAAYDYSQLYSYATFPEVDFTVDLWVYIPATAITYSSRIPLYSWRQYNYSDYNSYVTCLDIYDSGTPGTLRLRRGNTGYNIETLSSSPIPTDEWVLLSFEHVADTDYIYINGVMVGSSANTEEPVRMDGNESTSVVVAYDQMDGYAISLGNMDNAIVFAQYRLSNSARYGGVTFTMPTEPFLP